MSRSRSGHSKHQYGSRRTAREPANPRRPGNSNIVQILAALLGAQKQGGGAQQPALSQDAVQSLVAALAKQLQQGSPSQPTKPANGSAQTLATAAQTTGGSFQSVMSKPSVQIGAAGLGIASLLQAIGAIAPPFGMGSASANAATSSSPMVGTLATVIALVVAGIGATSGWGSLLGIASSLIGAIGSAAKKSQ